MFLEYPTLSPVVYEFSSGIYSQYNIIFSTISVSLNGSEIFWFGGEQTVSGSGLASPNPTSVYANDSRSLNKLSRRFSGHLVCKIRTLAHFENFEGILWVRTRFYKL